MLFDRFTVHDITLREARIHCRVGGTGPPLLLLHGCPQTHVMWHKVAPTLAAHFTVVVSDLCGYGDSSKPRGTANHDNYSFRAMAGDQVDLMSSLEFGTYSAMGHDRGARVLHRMALDHPGALDRVVLPDILPTALMYAHTDHKFATHYWEWLFFTQGGDLPETLLSGNPEAFLRYELGDTIASGAVVPGAWDEYLRVLSAPGAMHGMCEDYRAGVSIDLEHDAADEGRLMEPPLLVLWGKENPVWQRFDMLQAWRRHAANVSGGAISAAHYLAEEAPDEVLAQVLPFVSR